jgi:hypothetical protein
MLADGASAVLVWWAIVAAILGGVALLVLIGFGLERLRTWRLRRAAIARGYTFDAQATGLLDLPIRNQPLFARGGDWEAKNAITLRRGDRELYVCDLDYRVGTIHGRARRRVTLGLARMNGIELPNFSIWPRGDDDLDRPIGALGGLQTMRGPVLDLRRTPEVHGAAAIAGVVEPDDADRWRRRVVRGEDADAVRQLLAALGDAEWERDRSLCVEGAGAWLAVYRRQRRVDPITLDRFLDSLEDAAAALGQAMSRLAR